VEKTRRFNDGSRPAVPVDEVIDVIEEEEEATNASDTSSPATQGTGIPYTINRRCTLRIPVNGIKTAALKELLRHGSPRTFR
jgi:hypothetical protein